MSHRILSLCLILSLSPFVSGQENKAVHFDPKSATQSVIWAAMQCKPYFTAANAFARDLTKKKAMSDLAKANGATIDWVFEVENINKSGITLKDEPERSGVAKGSVAMTVSAFNPKLKTNDFLYPLPIPNAEWVLTAKNGSKIRVQGKVAASFVELGTNDARIIFFIANPKLSPVEKK